ncbi:hypothetical protein Dvina_37275 [Dactylosporangium vinaceum]|nr:hypothetical protein Dvina_37275 [Dactylosporangium vinaceum]
MVEIVNSTAEVSPEPTPIAADYRHPPAEPFAGPPSTGGMRKLAVPARLRTDLPAALVFVGLAAVMLAGYWGDVRGRISAELPDDQVWFEWLLAHGAYCVRHATDPLFSMRQNVPAGVNMMTNTSVLGVTVPLAPVTLLLGPHITYLLWLGGAPAATAFAGYWVLSRHVVASPVAAAVGGGFAGFAPGTAHHAEGQPNFLSNFLLPFIALYVARLGRPGRRWTRDGPVLGLLVAYQVFINEEQLLVLALGCAVALTVSGVLRPRPGAAALRPFAAGLATAAGVAAVPLAYPLWWQFRGPQTYTANPLFNSWGEDLHALVTYPYNTVAGARATEATIGATEQNSWYGITTVAVVAVLVLVLWPSLPARTAAVTGLIFAILSLGPRLRVGGRLTAHDGPWALIPDGLPIVSQMMPSRLVYISTLAIAVLLALGWDRASADMILDVRLALALTLVPLFPTPTPVQPIDPVPHFITAGGWHAYVADGRTVVPLPVPSNGAGLAGLRWSAAALHEFAVPAGYFLGPDADHRAMMGPPSRPTTRLLDLAAYSPTALAVTDADRAAALDDIRYWRAAILVLDPRHRPDGLRQTVVKLFGPGRQVDDVWVWDVRDRT